MRPRTAIHRRLATADAAASQLTGLNKSLATIASIVQPQESHLKKLDDQLKKVQTDVTNLQAGLRRQSKAIKKLWRKVRKIARPTGPVEKIEPGVNTRTEEGEGTSDS